MEENNSNASNSPISVGGYVEHTSTDHVVRAEMAGVPVYEKYKGKEAHAEKEWLMTKGERAAMIVLMVLMALLILAVVVIQFLYISSALKILAFVFGNIIFIAGIAIFILVVALRHNKKDPAEMHYYDVDYEYSRFTDEVNDNSKEITKEEFYSDLK